MVTLILAASFQLCTTAHQEDEGKKRVHLFPLLKRSNLKTKMWSELVHPPSPLCASVFFICKIGLMMRTS